MNKFNLIFYICLSLLAFSCEDSAHKHEDEVHTKDEVEIFYTCSMHPQIKESHPGKCPICGMGLTKIEKEIDPIESGEDMPKDGESQKDKPPYYCQDDPTVRSLAPGECPLDGTPLIKEEPSRAVIGRVKLRKSQVSHFKADIFKVTPMKMRKEIRLLGTVMKSERRQSNIPAQVPGRVEDVFIQSTGALIKKGDPVLKLYSPKLLTTGEEYLIARKNYLNHSKNSQFKDLYSQARERLKLWGILDKQLKAWEKKGEIPREIVIYSNVTGIVEKKNAVVGKYFNEGSSFFDLVDLSKVWVELDVYEHDAGLIENGQSVIMEFNSYPGEVWEGQIDFISPVLDELSRTLKVRTTLTNDKGKLKPGMAANAVVEIKLEGMPLVIPRSAVIDTGKRKIVWLKTGKIRYQAVEVQTGFESSGHVEIKSGLKEGEEVVIQGNFLLDAQAELFGGYDGEDDAR